MNMRSIWSSRRKLLMLTALLSFGAVGIALVLQYQFDMRPCPWCTLQRLAYVCIGALALICLIIPYTTSRILSLAVILCALSGIYMAGYQHFVASKTECMFTWPDKFLMKIGADGLAPWMFRATAQCSEANQPLLGLPFSWWSAALFALLAMLMIRVVLLRK
jgi:protein dithiol:quinone oxidoreductase